MFLQRKRYIFRSRCRTVRAHSTWRAWAEREFGPVHSARVGGALMVASERARTAGVLTGRRRGAATRHRPPATRTVPRAGSRAAVAPHAPSLVSLRPRPRRLWIPRVRESGRLEQGWRDSFSDAESAVTVAASRATVLPSQRRAGGESPRRVRAGGSELAASGRSVLACFARTAGEGCGCLKRPS